MPPKHEAVRRDLANLRGLDVRSVRSVRRRYSKALKAEPPGEVLRLVRSLLVDADWPERLIAWEVLAAHRGAFARMNNRSVEQMADGLADWASVDTFGVTIAGPAWRESLVTDATVVSWAKSPDRWRRRLALVSTVPLNSRARGGTGDPRRTLRICRLLLDDRDDMVVKALSWALRELAKRNPDAVEAFVAKMEPRLAPRVRREVRNKLKTGLKSPRRR